jgi:hypothetical protein
LGEKWEMPFHYSKCKKVMHIGHNNSGYEYNMRGKNTETTEEERGIGVMITNKLKTSVQCYYTSFAGASITETDSHSSGSTNNIPHLKFSSPAWSSMAAGRQGHDGESTGKSSENGGQTKKRELFR